MPTEGIFYSSQFNNPRNVREELTTRHRTSHSDFKIIEVLPGNSKQTRKISRKSFLSKRDKQQGKNRQKKPIRPDTKKCQCECKNSDEIGITGFSNIMDKKSSIWIRLFWLLAVSTCISITIYQIIDCIGTYSKNPISESVKVVYENQIRIPNFTICPSILYYETFTAYRFNYDRLTEELQYEKTNPTNKDAEEFKIWIKNVTTITEERLKLLNQSVIRDITRALNELKDNNIEVTWLCPTKQIKKISERVGSKSFLHLKPDHKTMTDEEKKARKDLEVCKPKEPPEIVYTIYGKCYTFHFTETLSYKGLDTKLKIEVRAESKTNNRSDHPIIQIELGIGFKKPSEKKGFIFAMFSGDNLSKYRYYRNSRDIKHRKRITASVKSKEFKRVNSSSHKCADSEEVTHCIDVCLDKQMPFHCRLPFMKFGLPDCKTEELINTYFEAFRIYEENTRSNCMHCPRFCEKMAYGLALSEDSLEEEEDVDNYAQLELLFDDNTHEVISENFTYTFSQLLSDIGGSLGLFLGCCILSLLEMLQGISKSIIARHFQRKTDVEKRDRLNDKYVHQNQREKQVPTLFQSNVIIDVE